MSIDERMDKPNAVHPHEGILFSHQQELSSDGAAACINPGDLVLSEKSPDTKHHMSYDSIAVQCPDPADSETESRLAAAKGREKRGWKVTTSGSGFWGVGWGDEIF